MRVTANMSAANSVYNIQQARNRLDQLQETITSNQNINRPSDDPISSRVLLDIGDKLKALDQYNANIIKANSWMKMSDTSMTAMNDTLLQTKSLMNTFTSGSSDPNDRQNVHNQLVDLKRQIMDFANTQYGDQYIFGGANNLVAPFQEKTGDLTTGTNTVANINVTGLSVGMQVSGSGLPTTSRTFISGVTAGPPSSITLTNNANATLSATTLDFSVGSGIIAANGDLTTAGTTINNITSLTGLTTGMQVSGAGIPVNTVISSITAGTPASITLSNPATATAAGSALKFFPFATERQLEISQATPQTISISGDRLLRGYGTNPSYGTTDILQMYDNLIAAVGDSTNPSDPVAIANAVKDLDPATKQVFNAVNLNLSRMTRVDNMSKLNTNNRTTLTDIVGNIQNVDMVKIGVQLNSEQNAFQASLSATAKLSQMSLLDYMP